MKLSDSDWLVLNALWQGGSLTARQVHETVHEQTSWAYSTTKTVLDRMATKQVVAIHKDNHVNTYRALVSSSDARQSATQNFLSRVFGGSVSSLVHHVMAEESLNTHQREALKRFLDNSQSESHEAADEETSSPDKPS